MTEFVDQVRKIGWLAVEAALLLVVLCVLLSIILGTEGGGPFISSVAANATKFLQALPPGVIVGLVLVVLLFWFVRSARTR